MGAFAMAENSDPTYEAWKPNSAEYDCGGVHDSDPTYEAWKLK